MKKLNLRFANFGHVHILDEADGGLQRTIEISLIGSNLTDSELRSLPKVLIITFGNRHVELVPHSRFDFPEDSALILQRLTRLNK